MFKTFKFYEIKNNACCALCGIDMGFETDEDVYCDACSPWRP